MEVLDWPDTWCSHIGWEVHADSGPGQAWLSDSLAVDCKPHHACTLSFREREREREREF